MTHTLYTLTSPEFTGEVLFGYDQHGYLVYFEVKAELTPHQQEYLYGRMPTNQGLVYASFAKTKAIIREVPADLSFDRFWKAYHNKVGKKEASDKWKRMNDADKIAALAYLPRYFNSLGTVAALYPATYLNKRRWEDGK